MKNFIILGKIGEGNLFFYNAKNKGAYSEVLKVKRISDNYEYAMKKVKMGQLKIKEKENALNEIRILASIEDPYIISYKEAFIDESSFSLVIVMEYADGGDLFKKISSHLQKRSLIQEKEIWKMLYQMLMALKTLHSMNILHRDLKSANVFLTSNSNYKLGDMNVSKVARSGLVYTQTGTPYYASPEVWKDKPYDSKSDIWSLGCVAYEMAALKPPFRAADMEGLYKQVVKGIFERIPVQYSGDLMQIISQCLSTNTKQRPSAESILNNPIFQKNTKEYRQNDESYNNNIDPYAYQVNSYFNLMLSLGKIFYSKQLNYQRIQKCFPKSFQNLNTLNLREINLLKILARKTGNYQFNNQIQSSFLPKLNVKSENLSKNNNRHNQQRSIDVQQNRKQNRYSRLNNSIDYEEQSDIRQKQILNEQQSEENKKKRQSSLYHNAQNQNSQSRIHKVQQIYRRPQKSDDSYEANLNLKISVVPPNAIPPILRNVDSQLKYINASSSRLQNNVVQQALVLDQQVKKQKQIQQKPVWWG